MLASITVAPCFESMAAIADRLRSTCDDHRIPDSVRVPLQICLDEILSNIVKFSGASQATVEWGPSGGIFYLRFTDDGIPFDPLEHRPDLDDPLPMGGLGIFMVKESADTLHYEYRDARNILTLGIQLPHKEDPSCTNRPAP